ncbi:DUF2142 domain-containing protein [Curtobacterium sp. Leaf261]|uniref:DUF2142 domain-containing protein n=1 Tax=Curtobacterium sp. Leaf261 TaxID=1736311 RepID=UPI0006F5326C|nr:DUF2142 domain-containing protein [Curtobacterium sp. Leaf261]KQO62171.1 hypothetical protein ASF23_10095 [Curtobacterium sp. Leaf261]
MTVNTEPDPDASSGQDPDRTLHDETGTSTAGGSDDVGSAHLPTATAEHPAAEHAVAEHPAAEHAVAEHPAPEHPTTLRQRRARPRTRSVVQFVAFLVIFLLGGAAFIAATPPGQNSDEPTHVLRAWQVAHGGLVSTEAENVPDVRDGTAGGMVSSALNEFFEGAQVNRGFDETALFNDIDWAKLGTITDDGSRSWATFTNTVQYPPVAYVPQVVAIWVSDALHLPVLAMIELGRVFGLLSVAGLLFAAAKITPVGRLAVFAVGLLPSTIGQAAAFSADGVTIALSVFATTLVLRYALRRAPVGARGWIALAVVFAAIAFVKPTYAPLAVIAVVIPVLNVHARRIWALVSTAAVVAVAGGLTLLWLHLTSWVSAGVNPANDPALQKTYVLHHPLALVKAFIKSVVLDGPTGLTDQKGEIWRGVFGDFAWLRAPLPMLFVLLLTVGLVLSMLVVEPRERADIARLRHGVLWRVGVAVTVVIVVGAVAAALYIYYTPTYGTVLMGLQGRYFLPVLVALMLLFVGNRVVRQKHVWVYVFAASAVSVLAALVTIDLRFYNAILPVLA